MHRKEHAAAGADRDIADGLRILEYDLEGCIAQCRCRSQVRIRLAASLSDPQDDRENDSQYQ